jgi:transcriptional regulator with XRE-family HTH domain
MGKYPRRKPERLMEKLVQIRTSLGLSQNGMVRRLGLEGEILRETISGYELGTIEPPLPVLLLYARAANLYMDALVDDDVDLPARLPSVRKSEGVRHSSPRSKRR